MARGRGRGQSGSRARVRGRGGAARTGTLNVDEHAPGVFESTGLAIALDDILQTGLRLGSDADDGSTTAVDSDPDVEPEFLRASGGTRARPRPQESRDEEIARSYYGPEVTLAQPTGPPLDVEEEIGGLIVDDPTRDVRINVLLPDVPSFTISVHPLHLPNTRAMFGSASSTSLVDWRFVRLAGLLPTMVPIRLGVDRVDIRSLYGGGPMRIYGRVNLLFDAQGYEFELPCWVTDIAFPVEVMLGVDWARGSGLSTRLFPFEITRADARKTRAVDDVYRMR